MKNIVVYKYVLMIVLVILSAILILTPNTEVSAHAEEEVNVAVVAETDEIDTYVQGTLEWEDDWNQRDII